MQPVLEAVDAGYRVSARWLLRHTTLALRPGEVLAVAGPNGAGKSTLLRLLAGDLQPSEGEIRIDGLTLNQMPASLLALRRAVLPQQTLLQFAFTAHEVVAMGRYPHRALAASRRDTEVIARAMERTETRALAHRSYPTLSGGEAQRVSLARVLAQETPILLLDEPTAALDIAHQQMVIRLAREAAAAGGAVLIVLHDLNLATDCADRVALLRDGSLVALGLTQEVLTSALLTDVYGYPIAVTPHPLRPGPLIVPVPER